MFQHRYRGSDGREGYACYNKYIPKWRGIIINKNMKKGIAILSLGAMLMSVSAMDVKGTMTNSMVASSSTMENTKSVKYACAAAAIDKRETAIISASDANAVAIKTSLTTRKEGLVKLYLSGKTEGRNDERKAVWSAFSSSTKLAMKNMRNARKLAWDNFQTDMRGCGIKSPNEKMETITTPIAY